MEQHTDRTSGRCQCRGGLTGGHSSINLSQHILPLADPHVSFHSYVSFFHLSYFPLHDSVEKAECDVEATSQEPFTGLSCVL